MSYVDDEGLSYYSSIVKKDINTKASIDSPALTGTPTAPTPEDSTNESQIATVGYVRSNIDTVNTAIEKAQSMADSAMSTANTAQSAAESAQTNADNAQKSATDALETANDARAIADEANSNASTAINNVESAIGAAEAATNAAEEATNAAQAATDAVNSFQDAIDTANTTANEALDTATNAEATAQSALDSVVGFQDIINNAIDIANEAQSTANNAISSAEEAKNEADMALDNIDNINESLISLSNDISEIKTYSYVGEVDLNDYYDEYSRIYVTSGSQNIPTYVESFFVDVDINDSRDTVRQISTGAATCSIYIRTGSLTNNDDVPLAKTDGTIVINGNLASDLCVNGNIQVTGTISGTVSASGSITYGTLTGTADDGVDISPKDCDIQVDGGNLTFDSDVTPDDNNTNDVLYTTGTVTNESSATTILYSSITIETDSQYGFYNVGNITLDSGVIKSTNKNSSGYAVYNSGTCIVTGTIYGYADSDSYAVFGTFSGSGSVYANDNEYYAGDRSGSDDGGGSNYTVDWGDWVTISEGSSVQKTSAGNGTNIIYVDNDVFRVSTYTVGSSTTPVYLSNGTITEANTMVDLSSEQTITGVKTFNGVTITSEGHIKLPSGVEFY